MNMIDKKWSQKILRGFEREEKNSLAWLYAKSLKDAGALHGISTRRGGVSSMPALKSLNLGWNRPEERSNIEENYRRLADAAGFDFDSMALVNYEHGDGVEIAHDEDAGKGWKSGEFSKCDALITQSPNLTLITLHADCMPVFLYCPSKRIGSMIHAGWKGTSMRIAGKAFQRLLEEFNCRADDILIAVGPSISQKNFEVDENVFDIFNREFPEHLNIDGINGEAVIVKDNERNKFYIDLWAIMALQLMEVGALAQNMTFSTACTFDGADDFYSYRRDAKGCGAMAAFLRV